MTFKADINQIESLRSTTTSKVVREREHTELTIISSKMSQKVAIVTGASSGIGYEISKELAKVNYKVYACARRLEPIESLAAEYKNVVPHKLDISNHEDVAEFREFLKQELKGSGIDVLYNNAGQSCTMPALDVQNDAIEQCFKVNVFGHMNMCRELSSFVIQAKGTIVFTGSIAGLLPFPYSSIYSSTKAAIHAYARTLHLEMQPFGVRVINVITGGVKTNIADVRPLPDNSVYNFREGKDSFASRQTMAKDNKPISASDYAKQLVTDIQSSKDPVDIYRGTFARIALLLFLFVPYRVLEWGLAKKFKLDRVHTFLKNNVSKSKTD